MGWSVWLLTKGEPWLNVPILNSVSDLLGKLRDLVVGRVNLALIEPHGSLLNGILIGNRIKLDKEMIKIFQVVGLSHIIAVSGYNLTVITKNLNTLFSGYSRKISLIITLTLIFGFVVISGAPASILRAAMMSFFILLAEYIGRPKNSINIIVFATAILAVFVPKILFDIGFQLSVAATYGMIRIAPLILSAARNIKIPEILKGVLAETLSATIMASPIIVYYFGRLSVISPIANILVVPLVPLTMLMGFIGIIAALIYFPLGKYVLLISWPLLEWIIEISKWLSHLKYASVQLSTPAWAIILLMVMIVSLVEALSSSTKLQKKLHLTSELELALAQA